MSCKVQIKRPVVETKDQSALRKTYEFGGEVFTCMPNEIKSVPDEVARGWIAHDSDMEIIVSEKVAPGEPYV